MSDSRATTFCRRCGDATPVTRSPNCRLCREEVLAGYDRTDEEVSDAYERKTRAILEGERRQFHHEVLCRVLGEYVRSALSSDERCNPSEMLELVRAQVSSARYYADLAYPPPKEQP